MIRIIDMCRDLQLKLQALDDGCTSDHFIIIIIIIIIYLLKTQLKLTVVCK